MLFGYATTTTVLADTELYPNNVARGANRTENSAEANAFGVSALNSVQTIVEGVA